VSLSTRIALGVAVVLVLTLIGLGAAMTRVTRATLTGDRRPSRHLGGAS
jgi:hypothetical protein